MAPRAKIGSRGVSQIKVLEQYRKEKEEAEHQKWLERLP